MLRHWWAARQQEMHLQTVRWPQVNLYRDSAKGEMRETIIIIKTKNANRVYDRLNDGTRRFTEYMNFTLCPRGVQLDALKDLQKQVNKS
jgi:hypothetical protein